MTPSKNLKPAMFMKSREEFEWLHFPKHRLLRCQNFLKVKFCLRLGPRAAAPEATHRCIRQPGRATLWSSSGFSRPRQRWIRRTTGAVASDEGFGRGDRCEEIAAMLIRFIVQVLVAFVLTFCGKRANTTCNTNFVVFCDQDSIVSFDSPRSVV